MRFSQFAGTAVVPTLSRLVLALIFITAGSNKIFSVAVFDEAQATRLRDMGAAVRKKADPVSHLAPLGAAGRLASYQATEPAAADDAVAQGSGIASAETPSATPANPLIPGTPSAADAPTLSPAVAASPMPLSPGEYEALSLYRIALLCDDHGMRWPFWLAWIAAVTEFVGGVLILVGLMTRFWALGLAIAMATAIALTTWGPYLTIGPFTVARGIGPDGMADGMRLFNQVGAQLSLFVLSFGVFLTGPGPLSLDHLIVRRQPKATDALGYDIDDDRDDDIPPRRPRRAPDGDDDAPRPVRPRTYDEEGTHEEIPVSPQPKIQLPKPDPVRSHERPI